MRPLPSFSVSSFYLPSHTTTAPTPKNNLGLYQQVDNSIRITIQRDADEVAGLCVHELMHAYLSQSKVSLSPSEEEGMCGKSSCFLNEIELLVYLFFNLLRDTEPTAMKSVSKVLKYSEGFQKAKRAWEKSSFDLRKLVEMCKHNQSLNI